MAGYWSLNFEEQFYIVMGLLMIASNRTGMHPFHGVLAIVAPAVIWNVAVPSTSYGFFPELWVPFALGAMVFYRASEDSTRRRKIVIDVVMAVMLAIALWIGPLPAPGVRSAFAEWAISVLFAIALIILRPFDSLYEKAFIGRLLTGLGTVSYSLYLTHQMLFRASHSVAAGILPPTAPRMAFLITEITCMVGAAWIFWYCFERPFLNRPLPSGRDKGIPLR